MPVTSDLISSTMKSSSANGHRGLELLTPEENEQLFRLIGNRCQCLSAGIIELYLTEPPEHNKWIKKHTGIITFIRDTKKRSFFLRLYCIQRKAMLWEHEIYNSMDYKAPLTYFHTFEAEDCMAAFNFANETEAIILRTFLLEKLLAKAKRRNERHSKMEMENQTSLLRNNQSISTPSLGLTLNAPDNFSNRKSSSVNVNRSMSNISMSKSIEKNRNQEAKKKLTTDDISLPFDFRHTEHVGVDIKNCRVINSELKALFDKVGIQEKDLEQEDTRDFIYDFIELHGGIKAVKKEVVSSASPINVQQQPVPKPLPQPKLEPLLAVPVQTVPANTNALSNNRYQRKARPLPPAETPPAPPNVPLVRRKLLSRPRAPVEAPPPPPLPMPKDPPSKPIINAPPPPPPLPNFNSQGDEDNDNCANHNKQTPDARCILMESIRTGIPLKKVNKEETKSLTPKDTKKNLLEEIRTGVTLKKIATEPQPINSTNKNSTTPNSAKGGLADALTRALAERSRAMYSESEDSSDFSDNDHEWDD